MRAQRLFLALGFLILMIIVAASVALDARSRSDAASVDHTLEVTNRLLNLRLPIRRAESGQRGYLLTGDHRFLDDYRQAADRIMPAFAELKTATADNPAQQQLLAQIEPQLIRRLAILDELLRLQAAGDNAAASALVGNGQGQTLMESISASFDRFGAEEQRLLAIRSAASRQTGAMLLAVNLFGAALILVIASACILMVRRSNQDRDAALRLVEAANAGLEAAVAERTEHLRLANEEIRRSTAVINNTVASMTEAVLAVDEQRTILLSNPAAMRLFGYSPGMTIEQLAGRNLGLQTDGVTPLAADQSPMARALRGEQFDGVEFAMRRADETNLNHIVASGRPLADTSGAISGAVLVYRDITEARATELQLRQAQKMDAIGHLTGGIAHDFNNMLTVVIGSIDILAASLAHDPELVAIARMIDQAAERGAELTRHLLAFARKQTLQPQATDVNALIVETAKLLKPAIGEQIEIESMLEGDAWPAMIDPGQLATALLNLSLNARDAMPGGGKLTLESGNVILDEAYARSNTEVTPGPYLMVAISDSGAGIPAAILDRVFEPFFTTKEIGKGTGLGLSMVYGFVKQSNGHIKIYSEEGHGTTIKIYLPRAGEQAAALAEAKPRVPVACGDETILVVEDDAMVLNYVITQLESLGYTTIAAGNGAEALAVVDQGTEFDLLFTDVIMPGGINGSQLAAAILTRRPRTKVLFTSGYTENAIVHHGRLDPGVLLLGKPYRKSDLAQIVRTALDDAPAAAARKPAARAPLRTRPYG
jgi:PAS domain S-box-containing protein